MKPPSTIILLLLLLLFSISCGKEVPLDLVKKILAQLHTIDGNYNGTLQGNVHSLEAELRKRSGEDDATEKDEEFEKQDAAKAGYDRTTPL